MPHRKKSKHPDLSEVLPKNSQSDRPNRFEEKGKNLGFLRQKLILRKTQKKVKLCFFVLFLLFLADLELLEVIFHRASNAHIKSCFGNFFIRFQNNFGFWDTDLELKILRNAGHCLSFSSYVDYFTLKPLPICFSNIFR